MSVATKMLAMFRWQKMSPGSKPKMVVSGQRESAQPIQRISGDWPLPIRSKSSGLSLARSRRHLELDSKATLKVSLDEAEEVSW